MSNTPDRALTLNSGEANKICIYCKSTHHWSDECEMYKTVDEQKQKLHGLCFICLKAGHRLKDCKSDTVLMQTAKTVVHNSSKPKTEEIRLLLDTGSQRTYITEALARKLNLKFEAVEQVSVVTFGSDKTANSGTPKVTLKMKLADGNFMTIDANVVPKITGTVLR